MRRVLVRLALDELDAVVDQVRVEVLDLLLRELDVVEPRGNLVVVEDPFFQTFLDELLKLFNLRERDLDGELRPPLSSRLSGGLTYRGAKKKAGSLIPGSPSRRG